VAYLLLNFALLLFSFPFGFQIAVIRNLSDPSLIVPATSWKLPLILSFVLVFTFGVLSTVAEFERDLLKERVRAGMAQARRDGKRLGRPPLRTLTVDEITKLRRERARTKVPFRKLAMQYGVSVWSAHRLCSKHRQSAT
jgi:DNA invertase Pin-like site-specific DNA recombinase